MPKSRRPMLSEAERERRREEARERMAAAIEELRSSEGWQRWLSARRHFHRYSFHNQLLIWGQCPEATYVAGFGRWLELGFCVRKGEQGIRIWKHCDPTKAQLKRWREEGADPDERPPGFFILVSVFDRSQVAELEGFEGERPRLDPPIEPLEGDGLAGLFKPLAAFAASIEYGVAVEPIPGRALGYCDRGQRKIAVEALSADYSANAQVKTLIHECAHALVGADRREEDPELRYGEEEVVVECVAYSVCASAGLDVSGYAVPYATSWSKGGEIERYAELIDRLARRIEDAVLVEPIAAETTEPKAALAA